MTPELRRLLPLAVAFLIGVVGSLLFAPGPRSTVVGDGGQELWALPPGQTLDLAVADEVWAQRFPWGRPPMSAEQAAAQAVPVAVPVGVVEDGGGLRALFSLDGALPVAVQEGGATPDGGTVSSIAETEIRWLDAQGGAKRVELFQQGPTVPSTDAPSDAPRPSSERRRNRRRQSPSLP